MRTFRYMLVVAAVVFIATAAIAFAGQRHAPAPPGHVSAKAAHARSHLAVRHDAAIRRASAASEQSAVDTDNVQQGDQTTPDTTGAPQESSSSGSSDEGGAGQEQTGDTEQGQPGEPAAGHEDPSGQDVNHECTGNCQE